MLAKFSGFVHLEDFHVPSKSDFSFDSYLANHFAPFSWERLGRRIRANSRLLQFSRNPNVARFRISHEISSIQGESMKNTKNIVLKDEKGDVSTVTIPNVCQSNGVIHVVDAVVLPN
jgi:hypothetical protein